jgi:hypothetical protein
MQNKISNKDAEMYRNIANEFVEKPDHETELSTVKNLELLIGGLHVLNVVAFASVANYLHLDGMLKYFSFALVFFIGIMLEGLKRKRSFLYCQTMVLAENHDDNNVRQRAYKRAKSQFPMLVVTWAIAVIAAIFSGIGAAYFFIPEIAEAKQNAQYENAWKSNIQALDAATKAGAGIQKIKALQDAINQSKADYETDKKNVENYNAQKKSEHWEEISVYGLAGGAFGFALECCLFLAITGLFKKKFEIAASLNALNVESSATMHSQQQAHIPNVPNLPNVQNVPNGQMRVNGIPSPSQTTTNLS